MPHPPLSRLAALASLVSFASIGTAACVPPDYAGANGPSCPPGTTWDGTQCNSPDNAGKTPICPSGFAWNGARCAAGAGAAPPPAQATSDAPPPPAAVATADPGTCPAASHWDGTRCVGEVAPACADGTHFVTGTGCVANGGGGGGPRHPHHATHVADRFWVAAAVTQDDRTSLTWARVVSPRAISFKEAQSYCASLSAEGSGWRLPSKDELLGIVEPGHRPATSLAAFPDTPPEEFWTSTSDVGTIMATVSFENGRAQSAPSGLSRRARCVRKTP